MFKKLKKKAIKTSKKIKKTSKKEIKKARKDLKKAGKSIDKKTGEIPGVIDRGYDLTKDELKDAGRYTEKQFDKVVSKLEALAEAEINDIYRKAYKDGVKEYVDLSAAIGTAYGKLTEEIIDIGLQASVGNFSKATDSIVALVDDKAMKPVIAEAKKTMGTSLVVMASVSVGYGLTAAGSFGVARNLGKGEPGLTVFSAAGGTVGAEASPSAGFSGLNIGVLRGDPTDIKGVFMDVSATAGITPGLGGTIGISFAPPTKFTPKAIAKAILPALFLVGPGQPSPDVSLSIGASYTFLLQRIKQKKL